MKSREFTGRTLARFRYIGTKAAGVLVFGMLVLLSMLVVATGPQAEPSERAERQWPVSYRVAEPAAVAPTLQVYGKLETDQSATLRAGLTANVAEVIAREGDWVEQGDTILRLDDGEVRLRLQSAQASLQRTEAALRSIRNEHELAQELGQHHQAQSVIASEKLERFRSLHERSMIADAQLDEVRHEANERAMVLARHMSTLGDYPNQEQQAEAAVVEAAARLAQAQLDMEHSNVRSPFSGRVLELNVATGDRISEGAPLVRVADFGRLQVRAPIPMEVAQRLRRNLDAGKPVMASTVLGGERLGFELRGLSGNVKAGQSGIDAFFRVSPDAGVALGGLVNLSIALPQESNVVLLPVHAVYDNTRVYRIEDNRLQAVEIERVGEHIDEAGNYRVLVRSSALSRGDQLMVSQLPTAMTGLLVNPTLADAASGDDSATAVLAGGQWSTL